MGQRLPTPPQECEAPSKKWTIRAMAFTNDLVLLAESQVG